MAFGFFDAEEAKSPEALALRQRLALQMMSQGKKGYPKNLGEGLTAVGDAIGDRFTAQRLDAQMAALERASAARGAGAAAAPVTPPAVPGNTDPTTGARSEIPATEQTAAVTPPADVPVQAPVQTAAVNPVQADQLGALLGTGDRTAPEEAGPQTASLDPNAGVAATPAPGNLPVRNAIAQQLLQRQGVPQPNPMLGGQAPAAMPSTFSPDDLGSPPEAAGNRPIEVPNIQLAQAGPLPASIKPPSAPSEDVPPARAETRWKAAPQFQQPPTFEKPPRMADPGAQEQGYLKAASDPMVLPSFQKQYAEEAARLAEKRKYDYDQAIKAFDTRNTLTSSEYQKERERQRDAARIEVEQQAAEQKRQQAEYTERIQRHLGGRDAGAIETNLYKSRASINNIPSTVQSIARTKAVIDKMYTGPYANAEAFLSQALPQTSIGFDPARGTATQQFKSAMSDIIAAHRAAIVGVGSQSAPELKLLLQASGADVTLSKDTIKEAVDAAERLMVKTAIAHQKEVHDYAGNFDPDRTRSVFSSFGVPGMADVVPQRSISKLMQHATNPEVLPQVMKDFDETYHTPGLAAQLIQREQVRQQRGR